MFDVKTEAGNGSGDAVHPAAANDTSVPATGGTVPASASLVGGDAPDGSGGDTVPEGWLRELWCNPFTRVLGAPEDWADLHDALVVEPERSELERKLPHNLRRYCVLRVFDAR